jgi:bacterioferritin-associated ferredoxin
MYVCICKAVTDKQIRNAAQDGVDNLYELREKLGVSSACGGCADQAKSILDEANSGYAEPSLFVPTGG